LINWIWVFWVFSFTSNTKIVTSSIVQERPMGQMSRSCSYLIRLRMGLRISLSNHFSMKCFFWLFEERIYWYCFSSGSWMSITSINLTWLQPFHFNDQFISIHTRINVVNVSVL
jgi:hypothetical protein